MSVLLSFIFIPIIIFIIEVFILVSILQDPKINNNSKIVWIILLLFTNFIGLLIYMFSSNKNILE